MPLSPLRVSLLYCSSLGHKDYVSTTISGLLTQFTAYKASSRSQNDKKSKSSDILEMYLFLANTDVDPSNAYITFLRDLVQRTNENLVAAEGGDLDTSCRAQLLFDPYTSRRHSNRCVLSFIFHTMNFNKFLSFLLHFH
jgi:hypothetical protein